MWSKLSPEFFKINKDRPYVNLAGNVLFAELKKTLFGFQITREMQLTNVILKTNFIQAN
jgi:hypothetical protein